MERSDSPLLPSGSLLSLGGAFWLRGEYRASVGKLLWRRQQPQTSSSEVQAAGSRLITKRRGLASKMKSSGWKRVTGSNREVGGGLRSISKPQAQGVAKLVARYKAARLGGTPSDMQSATQPRQDLLDRLSPQFPMTVATCSRRSGPQEASTSSLHWRAMEDTEQARQKYPIAYNESNKALGRQAELRGLSDLAVVERQLLQLRDMVEYQPEWIVKDFHAPYAGMKFKAEGRSKQGHRVFMVQKLHCGAWVDWVYISQSTIAGDGRGIFAARNFVDGEYIGRCLGRLLGVPKPVLAHCQRPWTSWV
ncbi:hypothetical protein WJX73_004768 [Symbiochloris irregularis]|uniref:Uncharacterized protein n=1 Tax=Symbiochloris irregularis TaxID=706552 RepID=A0AAW1NW60_9CHLO